MTRRLAVPAYFHPAVAADDWATLAGYAARLSAVVLNVDSGPGAVLEAELAAVAGRVAAGGGTVLGYVDTRYGARSPARVLGEIARYRAWFGVTGVFLDRVATDLASLGWYRGLTTRARAEGVRTLVANHGAWPAPGYGDLADALVTFEGPRSAYRTCRTPPWGHGYPADRFWHLVYDTPPAGLEPVLRQAAGSNVATVYVTDRRGANPWDGLPSYFERQAGAWESVVDCDGRG